MRTNRKPKARQPIAPAKKPKAKFTSASRSRTVSHKAHALRSPTTNKRPARAIEIPDGSSVGSAPGHVGHAQGPAPTSPAETDALASKPNERTAQDFQSALPAVEKRLGVFGTGSARLPMGTEILFGQWRYWASLTLAIQRAWLAGTGALSGLVPTARDCK